MSNTTPARRGRASSLSLVAALALVLGPSLAWSGAVDTEKTAPSAHALSTKQQAIVPIAAAMAAKQRINNSRTTAKPRSL